MRAALPVVGPRLPKPIDAVTEALWGVAPWTTREE